MQSKYLFSPKGFFDNKENAQKWLRAPCVELNNLSPIEAIKSEKGGGCFL
ncbi:antitoxin Xre/MbcA/ParS toxin-binding domain-containing protein [Marinomonas primoryensis]